MAQGECWSWGSNLPRGAAMVGKGQRSHDCQVPVMLQTSRKGFLRQIQASTAGTPICPGELGA